MEEKVIKVAEKKETFKEKVSKKCQKAKEWIVENKETATVLAPVLVTAMVDLVKIVAKQHRTKEEAYLKERMIYDRSKGHYVETRRKLKSREWEEFDRRRSLGEDVTSILNSMKLLK